MLTRKTILLAIGILLLALFLFILKFSWDIGRIASGMAFDVDEFIVDILDCFNPKN